MSMSDKKKSSAIVAGLALFSMFFGAGDLIWPLILGGSSGDKNLFAFFGLIITGVSLPLLGLIAMLLFNGEPKSFFGRIGKTPCFILIFLIQAILGPIGSLPRIIALSYATLKPYLPAYTTLFFFSILFSMLIFFFVLRKNKLITLLGLILTPVLLLSLASLFVIGFLHPPEAPALQLSSQEAFKSGLNVGYNTLDLVASFLFAPLVLSHFTASGDDSRENRQKAFKKMMQASCIAALLLGFMYFGLTYLASFYTPFLNAHPPEERLREISLLLLGPTGAFIASVAVVLACLTTAIPLIAISADYIRDDLCKKRVGIIGPLLLSLALSAAIANLGFIGIAKMLSPLLQILCPGLIVLSVLNILHKLYEIKVAKVPVYAAFALSTIGYAAFI